MRAFGFELSLPSVRRLEKRSAADLSDLKDPSSWLMHALLGQMASSTGIVVTPLKAMGVASVFACVRVLSDTIGSLPLHVWQKRGDYTNLITDLPICDALTNVSNPEMTAMDARCALQANLTLRSNSYAEILRNGLGEPAGLYPIEPGQCEVYRDPLTKEIKYRLMKNGTVLKAADVLHLRSNTWNGLVGHDATGTTREVIALALALLDNATKFFGNGSRPGGVLEHPASLSVEAQERLRTQMEEMTGGKNLYRMMVLEEGLKYTAQRSENKDSQFLESRNSQDLEICRIFGVPPHKIGITNNMPRANVEEENISFVMDTVRPIVVRWEQAMNWKFFSFEERVEGYTVRFDLDAILRGDIGTRFQAYATARQWGWFSANDVRRKEGLNPIEGGDVYFQPLNMADSTKATEIQMLKGAPPSDSTSDDPADPKDKKNKDDVAKKAALLLKK